MTVLSAGGGGVFRGGSGLLRLWGLERRGLGDALGLGTGTGLTPGLELATVLGLGRDGGDGGAPGGGGASSVLSSLPDGSLLSVEKRRM